MKYVSCVVKIKDDKGVEQELENRMSLDDNEEPTRAKVCVEFFGWCVENSVLELLGYDVLVKKN